MAIDWLSLLGNFGFPVAITFYLLFKFEKVLNSLSQNITKQTEVLNLLRNEFRFELKEIENKLNMIDEKIGK